MTDVDSNLSQRLRSHALQLVERVRIVLDIPSRSELIELTTRLEELDRRVAELATARVEELARPVPSLPAPETAVTEPVAEAAADAAADAAPTAEPVAETAGDAAPVEAAASTDGEPDAGGESVKDARRRKIGRRASANKTSRR